MFALAGAAGFVLDTVVLYLVKESLGVYYGRALSFSCAVLLTWVINRNFAFGHRASGVSLIREFVAYLKVMLVGGVVNYVVYVMLVMSINIIESEPVLAVAAGSIAGMFFNYISAKKFVFRKKRYQRVGLD